MNYLTYPTYDATIYEKVEIRNTGIDQIIELVKNVPHVYDKEDEYTWEGIYNSRILMKFNTDLLKTKVNSGEIPNTAKYFLNLKGTQAQSLPISYSLDVHALSQDWENGVGHYNDYPQVTEGVSWKYRNGFYAYSGLEWVSGSLLAGTTHSFATVEGGGTWYTGSNYYASQSFNYAQTPDTRIEITNIVNSWISDTIPNYGVIIKRPDAIESSNNFVGDIKFFSRDTHTVFIPRLEVLWDDSDLSGTGSLPEVGDDFLVNIPNIRKEYKLGSKIKFNLSVRDRYPQLTYSTSSFYLGHKRLPTSSYYAIQDSQTDEYLIPFDEEFTKLSIGTQGSYFKFDTEGLLPERFYKVVFKVVTQGGDIEQYVDEGFYFKIVR